MLIIHALTGAGGRFESNCEGQRGEPVLGKGRKCVERRRVWGWRGLVCASCSGKGHKRPRTLFQDAGIVTEAVIFLGTASTLVVAAATLKQQHS